MEHSSKLFGKACFIRAFEGALARAYDAGEVPGLVHLCTGAEVAEVALADALDPAVDQVTGSHRSHGLVLAMGADPLAVAKEILGRIGGLSDGLAGTQHLIAPENGFLTSNGIVGAQVPLAAGAALTAKVKGAGGVGVAVFGDGAANQGAVLESMNLAVALELPVLFVMENNGFGQSTASTYASGSTSFTQRAASFGLVAMQADGFNHIESQQVFAQAVKKARKNTPVFVEISVPRLDGHYYGDDISYMPEAHMKDTYDDPLHVMRQFLEESGTSASVLESIMLKQQARAVQVVAEASSAIKTGPLEIKAWHQSLEAVRG